jgi:hypothetical protein
MFVTDLFMAAVPVIPFALFGLATVRSPRRFVLGWRARVAAEAPSHLRGHPAEIIA